LADSAGRRILFRHMIARVDNRENASPPPLTIHLAAYRRTWQQYSRHRARHIPVALLGRSLCRLRHLPKACWRALLHTLRGFYCALTQPALAIPLPLRLHTCRTGYLRLPHHTTAYATAREPLLGFVATYHSQNSEGCLAYTTFCNLHMRKTKVARKACRLALPARY